MNNPIKHIAFFIPDMRAGGAERSTALLANSMAALGHRVDLVVMNARGEFIGDLIESVRIVNLGSRRFRHSISTFSRYLKEEKPDIVYSQMFETALFAASARAISGTRPRLVSTIRSTLSVQAKEVENLSIRGIKRRLSRYLAQLVHKWSVDEIVAVSGGVADDFSDLTGIPRDQIKVVPNLIDVEKIKKLSLETLDDSWFIGGDLPVFLGVGRLHQAKGFDNLVRAFSVVHQHIRCRLVILGEGVDRGNLLSLAHSLGVADDFSLKGFVSNPYPYMARCDTFVLSSRREGLPGVLREALALGTPVIATDCQSGPREILEGGKLGLLVEQDNVIALAGAMRDSLIPRFGQGQEPLM